MDKQMAVELMQEVMKLSEQVNRIMHKIEEIPADQDRNDMRRHIANVMVACDMHLFRPILRQYPELEPHW